MQEYICEVDVNAIRVSPFQPRRHFSSEEIDELASSIIAVGLIQPPVVRKIVSGDRLLYFELIAGERRWRACKKAGLDKINVLVRESTDENAARATLIENIQRVDLNPIEMAHAFKRLIDIFQMTQEEVSEKVGKKRSTVANYLRLLQLPKEIQDAVVEGSLTMGHAKAILSLDSEELQMKLGELIRSSEMTVRQAEEAGVEMAKRPPSAKKPRDLHLEALKEKLETLMKTKVEIKTRSVEEGKIEIHYYSLDDLDRLLTLMNHSLLES